MTDIIGDIHGHADELKKLLEKLGYEKQNGAYAHPERKVLFVGDYIDRIPQIREVLRIVRSMVDNEHAIALMGNHEYNAICFHYQETEGGHLRKHLIKNIIQHYETLNEFKNSQTEYEEYIEWFKSLPLFYEDDNFRAVHACWDQENIDFLKNHLHENKLTDELIYQSVRKESRLHAAIEDTLKGKEIKMPEGLFFTDKDGIIRSDFRIKWWEDPADCTYRDYSVLSLDNLPETAIQVSSDVQHKHYKASEKPVFFGHYWLPGKPELFRSNICCLDYSVAMKGILVCYRYNGETTLDNKNFVYV